MKLILQLLLLLFVATTGFSQTIYQFQYQLKQQDVNTNYDGLFVATDPGKATVRVKYLSKKDQSQVVFEMETIQQFLKDANGETDTSQLLYKVVSSKKIKGNDAAFPTVDIWFKIKAGAQIMEPAYVSPAGIVSTQSQNKILQFELLNSETLTKELVSNYFYESEPLYINLFKPSSRALSALEKKIKINLLIVANTGDSTIGIPCQNSMDLMEETFTNMAERLGVKIQVKKIFGPSYNKTNVEKEMELLKPAPSDILIFYYVGHGFRKPTDNRAFPYIDLRANPKESYKTQSLNMEDVAAKMKSKNARFTLILSDCCNSDPGALTTIAKADPVTKASNVEIDLEKCRTLFFNPKKMTLMMSSAEKGQLASCNPTLGAFYSFYFKNSLENSMSQVKVTNVSWYQIMEDSKAQTVDKANRTYCSRPFIAANFCKQTPFYLIQ